MCEILDLLIRKVLLILCLLGVNSFTQAQTKPRSNDLPPLSKAREIGRAKSSLLKVPKTIKKSSVAPKANLADFNKHIAPVFKKNCIACHGPKKDKGRFRVDKLNPNLLTGKDINKWPLLF